MSWYSKVALHDLCMRGTRARVSCPDLKLGGSMYILWYQGYGIHSAALSRTPRSEQIKKNRTRDLLSSTFSANWWATEVVNSSSTALLSLLELVDLLAIIFLVTKFHYLNITSQYFYAAFVFKKEVAFSFFL